MNGLLSSEEARVLYDKRAPIYDVAMRLYRLMGFPIGRYRRRAVEGLALQRGDTVVDLCCGTGLNVALLQESVGPVGRIVGVDLSAAMLGEARKRIRRAGWKNVELVQADVTRYALPEDVDGVLATFALEMVPDYDAVVRRCAEALPAGRRLALLGLKYPERWPEWLARLGIWLWRPFGVRRAYASLRPWKAVRRHLRETQFQELYLGAAYLSVSATPAEDDSENDEGKK